MNTQNFIRESIVLSILFAFLWIGCDSESNCCTIIDTEVYLHYQNQEGENLINSDTGFDENNIKIYYKEGEEYKYVRNDNLDYPNMYILDEDSENRLILTVFPSDIYEQNRSTTLIELNSEITDTLISEFDLDGNNSVFKRGWLNGVEIIDRFIEIKK